MNPFEFETWSRLEAHYLSKFFSSRPSFAFRLIGDVLHLFWRNPKSLSSDCTSATFGGQRCRSKTSDRVLKLLSSIQSSFLGPLCFHVFYFLTYFLLLFIPFSLIPLSLSAILSWILFFLKLNRRNSSCIFWTITLVVGPQWDRSVLFLFRLFFLLVCDDFCCSLCCMTPFSFDFILSVIYVLWYFRLSSHLWLDSYFIALVVFWWLVSSLVLLYDTFSSLFFFLPFFLFFFFLFLFFSLLFFLFMLFLTFFNTFSWSVSLVIRSIKTLPQRWSQDWLKVISEISWNTIWRIFDLSLNKKSHTFPSSLPQFTRFLIHLSKIVSLSWSFGRFPHIRRGKFKIGFQLMRLKHLFNIRQLRTLLFGLFWPSLLSLPSLLLLLQLKFQFPFFQLFFLILTWWL